MKTKGKFKVIMPEWWTELNNHTVYGYTDGINTYCCALTPAVFVEVPYFDYSGYFQRKDLQFINRKAFKS